MRVRDSDFNKSDGFTSSKCNTGPYCAIGTPRNFPAGWCFYGSLTNYWYIFTLCAGHSYSMFFYFCTTMKSIGNRENYYWHYLTVIIIYVYIIPMTTIRMTILQTLKVGRIYNFSKRLSIFYLWYRIQGKGIICPLPPNLWWIVY